MSGVCGVQGPRQTLPRPRLQVGIPHTTHTYTQINFPRLYIWADTPAYTHTSTRPSALPTYTHACTHTHTHVQINPDVDARLHSTALPTHTQTCTTVHIPSHTHTCARTPGYKHVCTLPPHSHPPHIRTCEDTVTDIHRCHCIHPQHVYINTNTCSEAQIYEHTRDVHPIATLTKIYLIQTHIQLPITSTPHTSTLIISTHAHPCR